MPVSHKQLIVASTRGWSHSIFLITALLSYWYYCYLWKSTLTFLPTPALYVFCHVWPFSSSKQNGKAQQTCAEQTNVYVLCAVESQCNASFTTLTDFWAPHCNAFLSVDGTKRCIEIRLYAQLGHSIAFKGWCFYFHTNLLSLFRPFASYGWSP